MEQLDLVKGALHRLPRIPAAHPKHVLHSPSDTSYFFRLFLILDLLHRLLALYSKKILPGRTHGETATIGAPKAPTLSIRAT